MSDRENELKEITHSARYVRYIDFHERNYFNIEDELMKLFCLMLIQTHYENNQQEYLSKKYVLEKISRLNTRLRISLDERGKVIFDILTKENNPRLYLLSEKEIINFYKNNGSNV